MKTSQRGIAAIMRDEGERLTAYFDIAGVPTISVGVTDGVTADDVRNKRTITREESQAMFAMALAPRESAVERLCTLKPNQNQFDAMVSLVYNIGEGNAKTGGGFMHSSVLRLHNVGDFQGAAKAFLLWNKARIAGELQVVKGLADRRARESALYLESVVTPQLTESLFERILKLLLALFKR
jgi:lysozyme